MTFLKTAGVFLLSVGVIIAGVFYYKQHTSVKQNSTLVAVTDITEPAQNSPRDIVEPAQQPLDETNVSRAGSAPASKASVATQTSSTASQTQTSTGSNSSSAAQANTSSSVTTKSTYGHVYTDAELLAMAGSVDLTKLPLGDGKYTTSTPKAGYVYVCHVATGGQGSPVIGPWIHGTTWDETAKIQVQGSVPWPNASVNITVTGSNRTIVSNDLPVNQNTGIFPIQQTDPAYQYDRNPGSIGAQNTSLQLPAYPTALSAPDCIYGVVGVMINGVNVNDAFDALYRDAPAHEEQDSCDGHPNNAGYHYHNLSSCFTSPSETHIIGWANDGFPITGPEMASGKYLSTSNLDECHGLTSTIQMDGGLVTTYHYVMTYDFPYSVSCYRGTSHEPRPGR